MRSLDACPQCQTGRMITYRTVSRGLNRRKYLKCNFCGHTGKESVRINQFGQVEIVVTNVGKTVQNFGQHIG